MLIDLFGFRLCFVIDFFGIRVCSIIKIYGAQTNYRESRSGGFIVDSFLLRSSSSY